RRPVPALPGGYRLWSVERGRVPELGPVAERGLDVEHGLLAHEDVPAQGHPARPDATALDLVAVEVAVLANHRSVADRQQIGANRREPREDHDVPADPRA